MDWIRRNLGLVLLLAAIAGINVAVLQYLHVEVTRQSCVFVVLVALTLAGLPVAVRLRPQVEDPIVLAASAFWMGVVGYTFLCFVLMHRVVYQALGWSTMAASPRLALAVMLVPAAWGLWTVLRRREVWRQIVLAPDQRPAILLAAVLALLMSTATIYGAFNNTIDAPHKTEPGFRDSTWKWDTLTLDRLSAEDSLRSSKIPDWGSNEDCTVHLVGLPGALYASGLPAPEVSHFGIPIFHLGVGLALAPYDEVLAIRSAKVTACFVWFFLLYCAGVYARNLFGLSRPLSWLVQLGFAIFAPVNWPPLRTEVSSYVGLVASSGTLYHNITQLYGLAMGLLGVLLAGAAIKRREADWPFLVGCVLGAASFFFKPSFYTIFAPAIVLIYPAFRRRLRWQGIAGLAAIFAPVAMWKLYPLFAHTQVLQIAWGIGPFYVLYGYAKLRFSKWLISQKVLGVLAIMTLSFAAFVLPTIEYSLRLITVFCRWGPNWLLTFIRMRTFDVFVLLIFLAGMSSGLLLIERGRPGHGNFLWAAACAYLLTLPALLLLIVRSRSAIVRWTSWLILPLHYWAGIVHLYIYVFLGHL